MDIDQQISGGGGLCVYGVWIKILLTGSGTPAGQQFSSFLFSSFSIISFRASMPLCGFDHFYFGAPAVSMLAALQEERDKGAVGL